MWDVIEPRQISVVAAPLIEVDADLWNAVRLVVPAHEENPGPAESMVFPVVARAGRFVLLSGFELFLAALGAGATQVRVWRIEIEAGENLTEYAVAFSMRFDDAHGRDE